MKLNDQQQAAVESEGKRIAVVAGAGTGKTRTLVARIAHRIKDGADASRICAVTFTNKAARELRDRLKAEVGRDAKHIAVGTFHSLTAGFIRRLCEYSETPLRPDFSIYDDVDSGLLLEMVRKEISPALAKKHLAHRYSRAETLNAEHEDRDLPGFRIWQEYHRRLLSMNALDFDGILETFFAMLLAEPEVFERHAQRFSDILIDEMQDTDGVQWSLASLAVEAGRAFGGNLFVIGDPKQAIYSFRGADVSIIKGIMADPEWEVHALNRNYRSTIPIIDLANRAESAMDFPVELQTGGLVTEKPGARVSTLIANLHAVEARVIANEIQAHLDAGGKPQDVAVLYRAHAHSRRICEALDDAEIPYCRVGAEQDLWRMPETRQIIRLLRLACNPADDQSFAWVVNWPSERISTLALAELKLSSLEACSSMLATAGDQTEDLQRFSAEVDRDTPLIAALLSLDSILHLTDTGKYGALAVDCALAIETIGEWAEPETERIDHVQNGEVNATITIDAPTVGDFLDWFVSRSVQDEIRNQRDAVTLCTVHAAKGLEFPIVFVAGLEEGRFPNARKDTDPAEELRLFYVAVTRARSELYLTRATEHSRGGFIEPSRFLALLESGERKSA